MCGIFISNDPLVSQKSYEVIEKKLRFREPDFSSRLEVVGEWKAYHSRLAIINPKAGSNQPVINKDKSILVFNREILNYKELGKKYFDKDYQSDTYLLNDLIINNKIVIDELDGFFSFVYIDKLGKLKYCVRDKFGVKPLFYFTRKGFVTISSEPITLQKIFSLEVNPKAVEGYRVFRAPLLAGSFFNGVKQVEPRSCLINGTYFSVLDFLGADYRDISTKELRKKLTKAIKTREVSSLKFK